MFDLNTWMEVDGPQATLRTELDALRALGRLHGSTGMFLSRDMRADNLDWYWTVGYRIEQVAEDEDVPRWRVLNAYKSGFRDGVAARARAHAREDRKPAPARKRGARASA